MLLSVLSVRIVSTQLQPQLSREMDAIHFGLYSVFCRASHTGDVIRVPDPCRLAVAVVAAAAAIAVVHDEKRAAAPWRRPRELG